MKNRAMKNGTLIFIHIFLIILCIIGIIFLGNHFSTYSVIFTIPITLVYLFIFLYEAINLAENSFGLELFKMKAAVKPNASDNRYNLYFSQGLFWIKYKEDLSFQDAMHTAQVFIAADNADRAKRKKFNRAKMVKITPESYN